MKTEAEDKEDKLVNMLADGWSIAGYSTTIMAAGGMTHSILLRKGSGLIATSAVLMGDREIGRTFAALSPMPQPKKGWLD